MDGASFDDLSRLVSRLRSRRAAMRAVLGGAVATVGLAASEEGEAKKKACGPCRKRKRGRCKKKQPNGTPCGGCGAVCEDGRCDSPCAAPQVCGGGPTETCCLPNGAVCDIGNPGACCNQTCSCIPGPECVCIS